MWGFRSFGPKLGNDAEESASFSASIIQIIKMIEMESEDVFSLNEGTLYPILHSLEAEKCLEAYWCEAEGRKRKYYKITSKGLEELAGKEKEWNTFSTAVTKVLGGAKLAGA